MFITALDYISPNITFYHKGNLSHTSIFSGILSLIAILIVLVIGINDAVNLIQRADPNTFSFNSFIEDAGILQINSSSLFHYITPAKNVEGQYIYEEIDFTKFNIIGSFIYYTNFIHMSQNVPIKLIEHWIYGPCDKEDGAELTDIINATIFEKSACLKKYCSSKNQKCYDKGDPNFIWPEITHGTFNDKNTIYNFFVKKCDNSSIKELYGEDAYCKSDEEINGYFQHNAQILYLSFLNNYINVLDYENPSNKFIYKVDNILKNNQYTENFMSISPALVKSHTGLFFDEVKEDYSYSFDRNDVYTGTMDGLYTVYVFVLKNMMIYYERTYKKIQDAISDIGGIHQVITIIAICLNTIYNEYIILTDTSLLLNSSIKSEKKVYQEKLNHSQIINNKLDKLESNINNGTLEISKYSRKRINLNNKNNRNERKTRIIKRKMSTSKINNICSNIITTENCLSIEDKTKINKETIGNKESEENNNENKKNSYFYEYFLFRFSCKKKKIFFQTYENFRIKMISEEHLIRNHLNLYSLMKLSETEEDKKRNYQYQDLINLI